MGILASGSPAPLPGFLNSLAGPLDHYGYWIIALLLLLENIGVPVVPGEFAMIGGAIFAGTGRAGLNIVVVAIVAFVASVVGAEIGYLIGRYAGRELILRYGKYVFIKPHHLDRAEMIVSRYGGAVVVIARFIVGLRELNGIMAGITEMRRVTFTTYNMIGAAAWVATWVTIGGVAGDHIDTIYADVNRFSLYVLIALAVVLAAYITWRVLRRRKKRGDREDGEDPGNGDMQANGETQANGDTEANRENRGNTEVRADRDNQAATEQAGTEQAGTEQAGTEQAGTEHQANGEATPRPPVQERSEA